MKTLKIPSLDRRLLRTVGEEVEAEPVGEWPARSVQLALKLLREVRENVAVDLLQALEQVLSEGIEARSFVRVYSRFLPDADNDLTQIQELIDRVCSVGGAAGESLTAELRSLEEVYRTYRDRLAEALARASEPPRPIDWDRLKRESDADFAAGRFTAFETAENTLRGLPEQKTGKRMR
jgi:hypothetical protein